MTDFVFIDSGVGGIPYMTSLLQKEPGASCVYVADNANFPYGEKSHEEVIACVGQLVKKICLSFEPKVIVFACNTISVNALEVMRRDFPAIQFVGTVPAIKLAASVTKKKRIGLIATKSTCNNPYNLELKNQFAADCQLITRADAELISFIEEKGFTAGAEELKAAVKPAIDFFIKEDCDVLVLGCTHFLNIKEAFEEALRQAQGPGVIKIVDSVDGVVRHALGVLGAKPLGQGVGRDEVRPQGEKRFANEFCKTKLAAPSLYITGRENPSYKIICSHYNIRFGGKI